MWVLFHYLYLYKWCTSRQYIPACQVKLRLLWQKTQSSDTRFVFCQVLLQISQLTCAAFYPGFRNDIPTKYFKMLIK